MFVTSAAVLTCLAAAHLVAQKRALLEVTVRDQDGKPLSFVDVTVTQEGEFVSERSTDERGIAYIPVFPGTYRIVAQKDSYAVGVAFVSSPTGDAAVPITLTYVPEPDPFDGQIVPFGDPLPPPPKGVVQGRVVSPDGKPVSNAMVSVIGADTYHVNTADDGTFALEVPLNKPGPSVLGAAPPFPFPARRPLPPITELYESVSQGVAVAANQVTSGVEIRLKVKLRFRVTVHVADESGQVPSMAWVFFAGPEGSGNAIAAPDGLAELGPVPSGPLTIWAAAGGWRQGRYDLTDDIFYTDYDGSPRLAAYTRVEINNAPRDDISLVLRPGARIKGRVVFTGLQGRPEALKPLRVYGMVPQDNGYLDAIEDPNGRVARDGSFVLDGLVGQQCLTLWNIPAGWKLSSVDYRGIDISHTPMFFETGELVDQVRITLNPGDQASEPVQVRACGPH